MTTRQLEFHPEAELKYLAALSWYRDRSSVAASNFEDVFAQAILRIREAPERWPEYFATAENTPSTNSRSVLSIKTFLLTCLF